MTRRTARCALMVLACTSILHASASPLPPSSPALARPVPAPGSLLPQRVTFESRRRSQESARAETLPRVRLVATGGTISNRPGRRLTAEELLATIPEVATYAEADVEQFANVSSSELTLDQWLALARRLETLLRDGSDLTGVVVTSGTDTLEELAYFLHLTVRSERPVVVTGSMRPPGTQGYDGSANLLAAFRVAAHPDSRGRGVLVVLNDEILSGREAVKTDSRRLHTFQAIPYGVLGVVDTDRVLYNRKTVRRHTAHSEFDLTSVTALPRVDVLLTYQGAPGDIIRAAVAAGARGLVIATAAGSTSAAQAEAITEARRNGVVVVRASRTVAGRVRELETGPQGTNPNNSLSPRLAPPISAEDLTPVKARVLLMLALTRTSSPADIQRMFEQY